MNILTPNSPTAELQALDAAHHLHPFTHAEGLNKKGARIITRAEGCWLNDSDGNRILDAMAGLWCVNVGYGREELAEAAARQMRELPFYNTFFQTSHVPAINLAARLAELAPGDLNHVFFANSGSEANDTNLRMVRTYWDEKGQPGRHNIISRWNGYHGSCVGSGSLGGMKGMHAQGGMPIPGLFVGERVFELRPVSGPDGSPAVDFEMWETFRGLLLPVFRKQIPDLQPTFDEFASSLKQRAEGGV